MCLTHENGKDDAEMEQLYLMPGEERYTKFRDENGVPKIRYTYCSLPASCSIACAAQQMKPSGCVKIGSFRRIAAT